MEKAKKEQSYDICELASNPVLIELHNGYYMYYPYTKTFEHFIVLLLLFPTAAS